MNLNIILLSLGINFLLNSRLVRFRYLEWFHRYGDYLQPMLTRCRWTDGTLGALLFLGLPLVCFWSLYTEISSQSEMLGYCVSALTLLYCLGPNDLETQINSYVKALKYHDTPSIQHMTETIAKVDGNVSSQIRQKEMGNAFLIAANDRLFSVCVWFVLLGPMGALLHRLASELQKRYQGASGCFAQTLVDFYNILTWLPARFLAIGYASSGNFLEAMNRWRINDTVDIQKSAAMLSRSGAGALTSIQGTVVETSLKEYNDEIEWIDGIKRLIQRALIIWLVALAIMTLLGWVD